MKIAALFVALVLAPASALAECAWVLWQGSGQDPRVPFGEPDRWQPKDAAPSAQGCEALQRAAIKLNTDVKNIVLKRIPPEKHHLPAGESLDPESLRQFNWLWSLQYKCLPDTVDPRGPKGGQ